MLTVHFNGEVVRHKDVKAIQAGIKERNDAENRCKYGQQEILCPAWQKLLIDRKEIKSLTNFGHCYLSGCILCPNYKQRIDAGKTKKKFTVDWKTYRKLSSAAHWMIKDSQHKTIFVTLTFPQWKNKRGLIAKHKFTKSFYYDEITNKLFSKFAENLRSHYKCDHYVAVKEYGKTNNRVHFHLLASMPFVNFGKLNNAWNHAIQDFCFYSNCALQTDKGHSIIRNPVRAVRYVCKYFNKTYGRTSETRIVFISNKTLKQPVKINEINYNHIDLLKGYKSLYIKTYEHVTVFKITDRIEFNRFCTNILYPLFECTLKKSEFHYNISESPP